MDQKTKEILLSLKLSPLSGNAVYLSGPVDVVAEYTDNNWLVFIYDDFLDIEIAEDSNKDDENYKKAKNLKLVLQMRRDIMRKVVNEVLRVQEDFLLKQGPLKKLTLTEVAHTVGVDVSTVSRIVSRKYMKTPMGVYALRFFFVRESLKGLSTQELMRLIKEAMDKLGRDVTDERISQYLKNLGVSVARRTVNKYRKLISYNING